jgi:hypothetical protein
VSAEVGAGPYKAYLLSPTKPLFSRDYDASGFWGRIEEVDGIGSLWPKIPAILNAADDAPPTPWRVASWRSL